MIKPLYVYRPLLNGNQVRTWMKQAGYNSSLAAPDMHTTIMYSKQPFDWDALSPDLEPHSIPSSAVDRSVHQLDGGASVLQFYCSRLQSRWRQFMDAGASYDYPSLKSHITISYGGDSNADPYTGPLEFGPERWKEITGSYTPGEETVIKGSTRDRYGRLRFPVVLKSAVQKLDGLPELLINTRDELGDRPMSGSQQLRNMGGHDET